MMASQEEHERKIIIEFCHLLEKSKQLFSGLRELPPYGHKQWHLYFGKTFDVYTKLWKFQQQHRELLDTKYGLKRWQVGEIASKIGQLYYHFYLRTSDTAYLSEAFAFYYAIRGRSYYTRACREDRSELMVKKLRYYARFMVVCILLKKIRLLKGLIRELHKQIIEYGNIYDPDDQMEWSLVLDEVKAFVLAEPGVAVLNSESNPVMLTHRLLPAHIPPIEINQDMYLKLQEALIVGSNAFQVKFSELTMDMFRILQIIEREPNGDIPHLFEETPRNRYTGVPEPKIPQDGPPRRDTGNPHKFLLYKPSPNQVMVYLASSCDELSPNGAVLLYLSAEGYSPTQGVPSSVAAASTSAAEPAEEGYELGGLITTSKSDVYRDYSKETRASLNRCKEGQCLYPGDIYPFTRKPLFIIIDSDNSFAFQNIPRHFGQPLVILMSPTIMLPQLQASVCTIPASPEWTVHPVRQCAEDGVKAAHEPAHEPAHMRCDTFSNDHLQIIRTAVRKHCRCTAVSWPLQHRPQHIVVLDTQSSQPVASRVQFVHSLQVYKDWQYALNGVMFTCMVHRERRHQGNLFTMFLQTPIGGIAMSCDMDSIPITAYDRCQAILNSFMAETNTIIGRTKLDSNFYPFLGDDFLRTILFRYIFCEVALRLHRGFKMRANYPRCSPPIPEEIYDRPSLIDMMLEITTCLTIRAFFDNQREE